MAQAVSKFFICGSLMITAAITPGNCKTVPDSGTPLPPASLKISVISGRPAVDGVFLNGQGPFRFLIDTGAQTNQLDKVIADRLDLKPTFRAEMATIAGSTLVPGGRVARVTLGAATASDQEFLFSGLDGVHKLSTTIQGVIGQEFLSRFDYLLDLSGRRIVFGAEETEGGGRTSLNLVHSRPVVETDKGMLVLDSGSEVAILYAAWPEGSGTRFITASGSASGLEVREVRVQVAGRSYSTRAAAVPRAFSGQDVREDGLLPVSIFRTVYVSNSGKYVVLDPQSVQPVE